MINAHATNPDPVPPSDVFIAKMDGFQHTYFLCDLTVGTSAAQTATCLSDDDNSKCPYYIGQVFKYHTISSVLKPCPRGFKITLEEEGNDGDYK